MEPSLRAARIHLAEGRPSKSKKRKVGKKRVKKDPPSMESGLKAARVRSMEGRTAQSKKQRERKKRVKKEKAEKEVPPASHALGLPQRRPRSRKIKFLTHSIR